MYIIAGLGNPTKQYENTRHNAGFCVIDYLSEKYNIPVKQAGYKGLYGSGYIEGQKVILLKPQTYMNLSGQSVKQLAAFFHIPPQNIIVMFDDISLEPGRLRIRSDGSAGGHNGIKSIISCIGSQDFPRVKIGVGAKPHPDYDLANWVLSNFTASEEKDLASALERAADAALSIIDKGVPETANRYNGSKP